MITLKGSIVKTKRIHLFKAAYTLFAPLHWLFVDEHNSPAIVLAERSHFQQHISIIVNHMPRYLSYPNMAYPGDMYCITKIFGEIGKCLNIDQFRSAPLQQFFQLLQASM